MTEEHLKDDLREISYRPALVAASLFTLVFLISSIGSIVGGSRGHVLVIISSLPLSLFSMPLLDTLEDPAMLALVLYGLNFILGAVFWFAAILVTSNIRLFLSRRKLDYMLVSLIVVIILSALIFKSLRSYGFFIGLEGSASWKSGIPGKHVFTSSTTAKGHVIVGGMGWLAILTDNGWYSFKVPGMSRKTADSMVAVSPEMAYAKFGNEIYEISKKRWKRIPLDRSSGRLALIKDGSVINFSAMGLSVIKNGVVEPFDVFGDCVPSGTEAFTDSNGRIWSGGRLGHLACILNGDRINDITPKGIEDGQPAGDTATAFAEDAHGTIYLGTDNGMIYRMSKETAEKVKLHSSKELETITSMIFDNSGRLIVTTDSNVPSEALLNIDVEKRTVEPLSLPDKTRLVHPCCLVRDSRNVIWIGTSHGMYPMDEKQPAK